jgi:hypothetical protein
MAQTYGSRGVPTKNRSDWAIGWTVFAGIMMVIQGVWWAMAGLIALLEDEFFVVTPEYVFQFDATTWGWIHLAVGVLLFAAGLAVFSGAVWARTVGVIVAGFATLAAFAWLPWYPLWAILFITVSIGVIWALTAHGRDITTV